MNKSILRLAIPNIISNITVPLLSMIDMSIVGNLSNSVYIGAIATSSVIFNFIFWLFSFLRMGTSGFTAQQYGADNKQEIADVLIRSLSVAIGISLLIMIFQSYIFNWSFGFINASNQVKIHAARYYSIYIWATPAILGMYTFSGWFIGMQNSKTPMFIAIFINITNIILSLIFVYVFKLEFIGVAYASTISQILGLLVTIIIWYLKYNEFYTFFDLKKIFSKKDYIDFFKVNSNIFIRTLLLISVTSFFTSRSAQMGDLVLAANALLMQLFTLFSYIMDGFAYAAEALTGKYIGASKKSELNKLLKTLFIDGFLLSLFFILLYSTFTDQILNILTNKQEIIDICTEYQNWILIVPIAGFSAFLWDGVFVGATASAQMRNSMLIATILFYSIYFIFENSLGNNALWLAFIVYLSVRGLVQTWIFQYRIKRSFDQI